MPPIEYVPISTSAYLETKKEAIRHQVCFERKNIPQLHQWFVRSYGIDPWVGEGHLRHKIKRWRDLEAGQWRQAVSMQLHHNSRMSFFSARETQSAPTGSVLMPTSSLGIGEGQVGVSMASSYVVGPLSGRPLVPSGTNTNYGSNNFGIRNSYTNNVLPNSINAIGSTTQLNYDDGYGAPQGTPPSAVMGPCLCPYCDEPDTEGDHYSCALFM